MVIIPSSKALGIELIQKSADSLFNMGQEIAKTKNEKFRSLLEAARLAADIENAKRDAAIRSSAQAFDQSTQIGNELGQQGAFDAIRQYYDQGFQQPSMQGGLSQMAGGDAERILPGFQNFVEGIGQDPEYNLGRGPGIVDLIKQSVQKNMQSRPVVESQTPSIQQMDQAQNLQKNMFFDNLSGLNMTSNQPQSEMVGFQYASDDEKQARKPIVMLKPKKVEIKQPEQGEYIKGSYSERMDQILKSGRKKFDDAKTVQDKYQAMFDTQRMLIDNNTRFKRPISQMELGWMAGMGAGKTDDDAYHVVGKDGKSIVAVRLTKEEMRNEKTKAEALEKRYPDTYKSLGFKDAKEAARNIIGAAKDTAISVLKEKEIQQQTKNKQIQEVATALSNTTGWLSDNQIADFQAKLPEGYSIQKVEGGGQTSFMLPIFSNYAIADEQGNYFDVADLSTKNINIKNGEKKEVYNASRKSEIDKKGSKKVVTPKKELIDAPWRRNIQLMPGL